MPGLLNVTSIRSREGSSFLLEASKAGGFPLEARDSLGINAFGVNKLKLRLTSASRRRASQPVAKKEKGGKL